MNFGHPNLVIAVLLLLLFLRHEFAVAEFAFHGYAYEKESFMKSRRQYNAVVCILVGLCYS